MKHAFIKEYQSSYPVALLCKQLGVSRSGYYQHLAPKSEGALAKEAAAKALLEQITMIFEAKKKRYGSPRIHAELQKQEVACWGGSSA